MCSVVEDVENFLIKNPNPPTKHKPADGKDGEQMEDIQTEWKSDGHVNMTFKSHGMLHLLELSKSEYNMSEIPIKLLGMNDTDVELVMETMKVMNWHKYEKGS